MTLPTTPKRKCDGEARSNKYAKAREIADAKGEKRWGRVK